MWGRREARGGGGGAGLWRGALACRRRRKSRPAMVCGSRLAAGIEKGADGKASALLKQAEAEEKKAAKLGA